MMRPNTFHCSKVRNPEKLILEIKSIRAGNGPAAGLQPVRTVTHPTAPHTYVIVFL